MVEILLVTAKFAEVQRNLSQVVNAFLLSTTSHLVSVSAETPVASASSARSASCADCPASD